jgi:biopolymer transport protein ExbD
VAADGRAAHRHLVSVLDLLRRSGIHKFALDVDPTDLESARAESPPLSTEE